MRRILALVLAATLLPFAVQAEPGTLTRTETLRDKPYSDGKRLASLKAGQNVDVITREGGWYKIKAGSTTGYVSMLSVRRTGAAAAVSAGSLANVASGRAGTGQIVATTGIRGLNEEQMKEATFSETAVVAAEKLRVTVDDARAFARAASLNERQVPSLAEKKGK